MNVKKLIELLQNIDGSTEVKIAYQPKWPLYEKIRSVAEADGVLYIGGHDDAGYLSKAAYDALDREAPDRKWNIY